MLRLVRKLGWTAVLARVSSFCIGLAHETGSVITIGAFIGSRVAVLALKVRVVLGVLGVEWCCVVCVCTWRGA